MGSDFRQIVRFARKKACTYKLNYNENIPVKQLAEIVGEEMQNATQRGGVRPYGISILIIGFDFRGANLFQVDPSGSYFSFKGCAIGRKSFNQRNFLEKRFKHNMNFYDVIQCGLLTMKENFEGEMLSNNIQIGVSNSKGFTILKQHEVQDYIDSLS